MTSQVKYFNSLIHTGLSTFSSDSAGSFNTQLKTVFVDGFNAATVSSITRSGSTVTVTCSGAHNYIGRINYTDPYTVRIPQVVLIAGCTQTDYNGEWPIKEVTSSTVFTFDIGAATPVTPATGSPTCKVAPLGWTRAFSTTNVEVFRSPNILGTQAYYRFFEPASMLVPFNAFGAATGTITGKGITIQQYESMVDVSNGSRTGDGYIEKAPNASSYTTQPFMVIGDDTSAYIFYPYVSYVAGSSSAWVYNFIGDIQQPLYANDPYRAMLFGRNGQSSTNEQLYTSSACAYPALPNASATSMMSFSVAPNGYLARSVDGTMVKMPMALTAPLFDNSGYFGAGILHGNAPNLASKAWPVTAVQVSPTVERGVVPGLYNVGYFPPLSPAYASGVMEVPGFHITSGDTPRTMLVVRLPNTAGSLAAGLAFDCTGPWR